MTIDAYTFSMNNQSVFVCGEKKISGQQWAKECLVLAQKVKTYSERNWLLYQGDFYQFSQYFFALLLANKNIVLAQSNQLERLNHAAKFADISIGSINDESTRHELLLPCFCLYKNQGLNEVILTSSADTLTINANTCITLFTSGSTGEAKAVKKYWYQLASEIDCLQRLFPQVEEQACILSSVTHQHIYGLLFKLIWPVFTNKQIICETIEYPEQVEYYCQSFKNITFISSPSYLARTVEQFSAQATASIREVFCSGEALHFNVADGFLKFNQQVITEIYGSTETGGIAWRQQNLNTHWQLFPEHQVTLAQDGTLLLTSNFLPKGKSYKTDDRVELDGRFFSLLGRLDRIVKLHEKRLSLDEMEAALNNMQKVSACHCFILNTSKSKAGLVAVIQLEQCSTAPESSIQKKQLVNECKKILSLLFEASLLPRKWRFVQQLPFNNQGKLVKKVLVSLFE